MVDEPLLVAGELGGGGTSLVAGGRTTEGVGIVEPQLGHTVVGRGGPTAAANAAFTGPDTVCSWT